MRRNECAHHACRVHRVGIRDLLELLHIGLLEDNYLLDLLLQLFI